MKKIHAIVAAVFLICAQSYAGNTESVLLDERPPADKNWPFNVSLASTYEHAGLFADTAPVEDLWGARAEVSLLVTDSVSAGAFYSAAWAGGDTSNELFDKFGLALRLDLPFDVLEASPYLGLDAGAYGDDGEYDPFAAVALGISFPLDFVTAGLRADASAGYYGIFSSRYRDSLGIMLGLRYEF